MFVWQQVKEKEIKRNLKSSRNHATTRLRQKSCKGKILQLQDERKNRKIVLQRNEQQAKLEKKRKGEDERPHNIPNEIIEQRISAGPSGRLNKYEPLVTRDCFPFKIFTELSIGNIKKACECFYNMPETLLMF